MLNEKNNKNIIAFIVCSIFILIIGLFLAVSLGATLVVAIFFAVQIPVNTINVMIASLIGAIFSGIIIIGFIWRKANNSSITKILFVRQK